MQKAIKGLDQHFEIAVSHDRHDSRLGTHEILTAL